MLLNEPVPLLLHDPVLVAPVIVAESVVPGELEQIGLTVAMLTEAMARMLSLSESRSGMQFPLLVDVRISVAAPAPISSGPGEYTAFNRPALLKFPSPVLV